MGGSGDNGEAWTCCNDEQTLFILLYIAYAALALITWRTIIAKPMRLIAVRNLQSIVGTCPSIKSHQ
jgi:hypothetical protein